MFNFSKKTITVDYVDIGEEAYKVADVLYVLKSFEFKDAVAEYMLSDSDIADALVEEGILRVTHNMGTAVYSKTEKFASYIADFTSEYYLGFKTKKG